MSCDRQEAAPIEYFLPGDIVQSPGGSFSYEILSPPLSRVFDAPEDLKFPVQPHWFEYNGKAPRFCSYRARIVGTTREFYLTDRCLKGKRTRHEEVQTAWV